MYCYRTQLILLFFGNIYSIVVFVRNPIYMINKYLLRSFNPLIPLLFVVVKLYSQILRIQTNFYQEYFIRDNIKLLI